MKLKRDDLWSLEEYATERESFRAMILKQDFHDLHCFMFALHFIDCNFYHQLSFVHYGSETIETHKQHSSEDPKEGLRTWF